MGPTKISPEDQQFNISFVGEVKKHPCLFDSGSPEYKQSCKQEDAWTAVSEAVDESVDTCKKRWRNLRCCMTRYLKTIRDSNDISLTGGRRKPYYLFEHMQFVLPYLKARDENSTYETDDSSWIKGSSESETLVKNDDDDDEIEHQIETINVPEEDHNDDHIKNSIFQSIKIVPLTQEPQVVHDEHQQQHNVIQTNETTTTSGTATTFEFISSPPAVKQPRLSNAPSSVSSSSQSATHQIETTVDRSQRQFFTITGTPMHPSNIPISCYSTPSAIVTQQQSPTPNLTAQTQPQPHFALISGGSTMVSDADHNFFQSLVPDIQTMTMEQKRKLKIGILQLIDGILNT
ncbi:uncharacterized protein LOC128730745 [Anopheles nili]|uniref:uncharacterized protein LOC128730745 n=1 Tax=Anopheles nili TaxID=185578 RepID=UPI00237A0996|nr:uncharacterized protein LOC128730745 [Anopheles nili]